MLTWCGMRGLATLALALSLPGDSDGAAFPARAEIVVIASTVLVATLLLPGFTLRDGRRQADRERLEAIRRGRDVVQRIQTEALAAARAEVLAAPPRARIDPEAADRVLTRLDLRTVLLD